ncbi:hypothetical protein [Mycolicibacterium sp. 050158]|uniref:hypothetical protein n=1 Tax=Mycolicibacterium sp. 050158 TaxID=3090602 RepID=UPI00299EE94E|nr:hypothetical protein [Mycolicibacterium sp. 050158]MDX1889351.1 hypothetical protein [Mycolicibacterium sp. 050158]
MSTAPQDDWQSSQQWGSAADQGPLYGQPFDPTASNPRQQPPPPGWEQGAWTQHGHPADSNVTSPTWLLIGVGVVVLLVIAGVILLVV